MSLFKRLPFGSTPSWPPFPDEARAEFPSLADRFDELSSSLTPAFTEQDTAANGHQRTHRRVRLVLIIGAMVTSILGAVQAALDTAAWPGVTVTIIAAATAGITAWEKRESPLRKALKHRAKAEELRSLYFEYLGGLTGDRSLERAVAEIQFGKAASDG